jgi:DNA-binding response OmpR family regulator
MPRELSQQVDLLVDDDQEIRELLETYLTRAGFQVRGHRRMAPVSARR